MLPERNQYHITLEEIISNAKEIMLREGKHVPVLVVESGKSVVAGQIPNMPPTHGERVELMHFLGQVAAKSRRIDQLKQVFMVTEGWMSEPSEDRPERIRPAENPNTKEVLIISAIQVKDHRKQMEIFEIFHDSNEQVVSLEKFLPEEMKEDDPIEVLLLDAFVQDQRLEEERDIVLVGLGKELAVEAWLDEWNKLRTQGNIPNKIEVIELRTDPKYGGFFTHEPAKAKVSFKRLKENVEITIDDFISPTILERLRQQNKNNPLFQPQISDWRSMVDSVMIDSNYDGKVFNITLTDIPERKNDLVDGIYAVEAKKGVAVAVKVTDMFGEDVLVVKSV